MAKITITILDDSDGKVKVAVDPSFEIMAKMANAGEQMTSAHAYALRALRAIREESKAQGTSKILIPRIGL